MDKVLMTERFTRALATYDKEASVQKYIIDRLLEMLGTWTASPHAGPGRVLEIGCGTGLLTKRLVELFPDAHMWMNDICPSSEDCLRPLISPRRKFLPADAETLDFPEGMDLIISSSALQWIEDLPALLGKCERVLNQGGILAVSSFTKGNLMEIRQLTGKGLDYFTADELKDMLPPEVSLLEIREETVVQEYPSAMHVLRHLKDSGVTGTGRGSWTRTQLSDFERNYCEKFPRNGGVSLTYCPVWLIAAKR